MSVRRYLKRKWEELPDYIKRQAKDAEGYAALHLQKHGLPKSETDLITFARNVALNVGWHGRPQQGGQDNDTG